MAVDYLLGPSSNYRVCIQLHTPTGNKPRYFVELRNRDGLVIATEGWLLWGGAVRVARDMMAMIQEAKEPMQAKEWGEG